MGILKDYSHQQLAGNDFSGVDLTEADLSHADLHGANFAVALLADANLAFAEMAGVNLGETEEFFCVAIGPNGRLLASSSRKQVIQIWDVESGREVRVLPGHTAPVRAVVFSPDGRLLASGSDDTTARLWDVESGREVRVLQGHTEPVQAVAFSPDGRFLASGSGSTWIDKEKENNIRIWEVESGRAVRVLQGRMGPVQAVAFSPDGRFLASGSGSTWNDKEKENSIRIWEVESGREVRMLARFPEGISSVAFDSTGKSLLTLSSDLLVLDVAQGKVVLVLPGHTRAVFSVVISPDGQLVASGGDDNSIRLREVKSRREVRVLQGHAGPVRAVAFSPDGRFLVSGSDDKSVRLWDIESGSELRRFQGHTDYVRGVAFSPDGRFLVSGSGGTWNEKEKENSIRIWEVESGREMRGLQGHTGPVRALAFSPDGRFLVSGSDDKSVRLWDVESGSELRSFQGHTAYARSVAFSPDGRFVVSGSDDKSVRLWDVESGSELRSFQGHTDYVCSVAFSPDGRFLASGSGGTWNHKEKENSIRIWELESGREMRVLQGHMGPVRAVAFSPDGRFLVSGSDDKSVRLWDVESGNELCAFQGRLQPRVMQLLDEDRVAVAGDGGQVEIWRLVDLERILVQEVHTQEIIHLASTLHSHFLASASKDKSLRILDVATGRFRVIRQELHCLRANIFGVRGLRDDQRTLMLRKGAVEIDPQDLPQGWHTRNVRELLRNRRILSLVDAITESRKERRLPVILFIGPGTFLSAPALRDSAYLYGLGDSLNIPLEISEHDLLGAQRQFEVLYERLLMDQRYYQRYIDSRSPEAREIQRYRQQEPNRLLREAYSALIRLVNEGFFNVVIDLDVCSQLDQGMFAPSLFNAKYSEFEDFEYSLSRLGRDLRYVERGQPLFLKFFSEDWYRRASTSLEKRLDPLRIGRVLGDLLERVLYESRGHANVIWSGFHTRETAYAFSVSPDTEAYGSFFWIMDESIRETRADLRPATYLDYALGHFSDVFLDLYSQLGLNSRSTFPPLQDYDITLLRQLANSGKEEERIRASRELVLRLTARPATARSELEVSVGALRRDYAPAVRQATLRSILENYPRLPREVSDLVPEFARDPEESIRADLARWIVSEYNEVGKIYGPVLKELAQDKSLLVRHSIVDIVKKKFELLPADIRLLASQLVGTQIEVQMVKGGGMLVGETSELALRVTNHNETAFDLVEIQILESAEYQIISANPVAVANLLTGHSAEVKFHLKMKASRQVSVNYRVNGELKEPPLYISAIKDNPYVYGDAVKEGFWFVGRKEELEQIIQAVTKPAKQDILIVGERRTGKTSLIYHLLKRFEKPFIPVYVVLNIAEPKTEGVLECILHRIIASLRDCGLLGNEWKEPQIQYAAFEERVKEILDAAKSNLADLKIVLLLDEADYLLRIEANEPGFRGIVRAILGRRQIDERLQNILRATLQSSKVGGDVRAVVAGTTDLSTYISQRSSPFFNHFRLVHLEPLRTEEIRDLIARPASILGYSYSPNAAQRVAVLSGGQPFYCQALCYEAFGNAMKAGRYLIDHDDVDVAEEARTRDLFGAYLSYFWNRVSKTEKRFLAALARGSSVSEFSEAQIKRLLDWGLVSRSGQTYAFSGGLISKWTKMALSKA